VCKAQGEKGKRRRINSIVASSDGMYLPVSIMVNFLPVDGTAADCVLNCEGVPGMITGVVVLLVL